MRDCQPLAPVVAPPTPSGDCARGAPKPRGECARGAAPELSRCLILSCNLAVAVSSPRCPEERGDMAVLAVLARARGTSQPASRSLAAAGLHCSRVVGADRGGTVKGSLQSLRKAAKLAGSGGFGPRGEGTAWRRARRSKGVSTPSMAFANAPGKGSCHKSGSTLPSMSLSGVVGPLGALPTSMRVPSQRSESAVLGTESSAMKPPSVRALVL